MNGCDLIAAERQRQIEKEGAGRTAEKSAAAGPDRLFGVPDTEYLQVDIGAAYESQIDPYVDEHDRRPRVIEEWTVFPPRHHLRSPEDLVDWLIEDASESAGLDGYYDHAEALTRDPEVLAAADALIASIADRVTYRVAHERVAEHAVTWDADGEPLIDGEPLYVKRDES